MHRLEGVGQDRRLHPPARGVLALAEQQAVAELDRQRHLGQRAGVHDRLAQVGELPLGQLLVAAVDEVGDDPAEHGVAQELEPLVGRVAGVLRAPRAVGQGLVQQCRLLELVADPLRQRLQVRLARQGYFTLS